MNLGAKDRLQRGPYAPQNCFHNFMYANTHFGGKLIAFISFTPKGKEPFVQPDFLKACSS